MASSILTPGAFVGCSNLSIDCRRMPEDSQFKATLKYLPFDPFTSLSAVSPKLPQSFAGHKSQERKSRQSRACSWKAVDSKFTHSNKEGLRTLAERRHSCWKITLAGGRGLASVAGHVLSLGEWPGVHLWQNKQTRRGKENNPTDD